MNTKLVEALKAELDQLEKQYDDLRRQRDELRKRIASEQAVFNVGDQVRLEGGKIVYQITSIQPGYANEPIYIGARLKKNGDPCLIKQEIYSPSTKALCLVRPCADGDLTTTAGASL